MEFHDRSPVNIHGLETAIFPRLLLAAIMFAGCAANRPRLPTRIIDDPATLPKGMFSVSGSAQRNSFYHPVLDIDGTQALSANLRLGLGNRLELVNILGLRYAVLDDSPYGSAPDRLTVAVTGGLADAEIADDLVEDGGPTPFLNVHASKRVAARWLLEAELGQRTYAFEFRSAEYQPTLSSAGVGGLYQVSEVLAVRVDLHGYRWNHSARVWRPAVQGGFGPGVWLGVRPRRWLTVGAYARLTRAWAAYDRPGADPDRSVEQARAAYAEPRVQAGILGAHVSLHN